MFTNKKYLIIYVLSILILTATAGCSGDTGNPVIMSSDNPALQTLSEDTHFNTGRSIWGMFEIYYDPDSSAPLTLIPARESSMHLNIRKFLEDAPCSDCLSLDNFSPTQSGFSVDVTIKHPFGQSSGIYGFDVRGIFFFDGSLSFPCLGVQVSSSLAGDAHIANPDGYTRIFNPTEFTGSGILGYSKGHFVLPDMPDPSATIGAYKTYYSDGQSVDKGGRFAFNPGDEITRKYEVVLPAEGSMVFGYAIDSCWTPPSIQPPHGTEDFPQSANCLEPFKVEVFEDKNLLTPVSGSVILEIIAYDHQDAGAIKEVRVEAPGLFDGIIVSNMPTVLESNQAIFYVKVLCESGTASISGEEILIEVIHDDPDPNLGLMSAWAYTVVSVTNIQNKPVIEYIEPDNGYQFDIVPVTIHGVGFHEGVEVQLYKGLAVIEGMNVVVVDHQTITANFELAVPVGFFSLYVKNPTGSWDELTDIFEIVPN